MTTKITSTDPDAGFITDMKRATGATVVPFAEQNEMVKKATDIQIGGDHYKKYPIQPIEFYQANNLSYLQGAAIDYLIRHADKGGKEDLEKAKHCIDMMIQFEYPDEEQE